MVYFNDWYQGVNKSRKSRRLYGGLNTNDNVLLKLMKDSNKLMILEYNTFDYPTDELNSYRIQDRLKELLFQDGRENTSSLSILQQRVMKIFRSG